MPSVTLPDAAIPFEKLPYAFQQRLIDLAPISELSAFQLTGHESYRLASRRGIAFKTLYISNRPKNYKWVLQNSKKLARIQCVFPLLKYISHYVDGPYNFYPYFLNVLFKEEFFLLKRNIVVEQTLLLDFRAHKDYDIAIPLISGTYKQLVLHGRFKWTHVKQLMHSGVKQLQLSGFITMADDEYDDAVSFMLNRAKDPEFSLLVKTRHTIMFAKAFKDRLAAAFINHSTHVMKEIHYKSYSDFNSFTISNDVIDRNRHFFWKFLDCLTNGWIIPALITFFTLFLLGYTMVFDIRAGCVLALLICAITILLLLFDPLQGFSLHSTSNHEYE